MRNRIFTANALLKKSVEKPISGLAFIQVTDTNPIKMFHRWREDAEDCGRSYMNLATCTRSGLVSNRSMVVLKYVDDGLIFFTNRYSRKANMINENPNVASTFFWSYKKDDKLLVRQILIEGTAEVAGEETDREIFNMLPLFTKIRYIISQQGQPVEWQSQKMKHDELLSRVVSENVELDVPDHFITFKLVPKLMDFSFGYDNFIADRVKFQKIKKDTWEFCRLQA